MSWLSFFSKFGRSKKTNIDLISSLAEVIKASKLKKTQLSIVFPANLDGSVKRFKRSEIHLHDQKNLATWEVISLRELFRGDRKPPDIKRNIEEYVPFLYLVEKHVKTACQATKNLTDKKLFELYKAMSQNPDGKSLGLIHDVIWQCAALALGLRPYSKAEYEAVFLWLAQSAESWKRSKSSRNYIAYLRENF